MLAVAGTRIKAVNNKDRNFTGGALTKFIQAADEKLADYMKRLDQADTDEAQVTSNGRGAGRVDGKLAEKMAAIKSKRNLHKALLDELYKTGEDRPIPMPAPWCARRRWVSAITSRLPWM